MRIYKPHDRPDIEVLFEGRWYPGQLRGYWRRRGRRLYSVSWHTGRGLTQLDTVTRTRVRGLDRREAGTANPLR